MVAHLPHDWEIVSSNLGVAGFTFELLIRGKIIRFEIWTYVVRIVTDNNPGLLPASD